MSLLKDLLNEEYKTRANSFCIDDRQPQNIGANGRPLSWFCEMFAEVVSTGDIFSLTIGDEEIRVTLENVPVSSRVQDWARANDATLTRDDLRPVLSFTVIKGRQKILGSLATAIRSITAPGARYSTNYYKYSCPRTADSLERLKSVLARAWTNGSKTV